MTDHLAAIQAGNVTKTNIIGIRKALNAMDRRSRGYSTGPTCPQLTFEECDEILGALYRHKPKVTGELHDSGIKVLRNRRYAKRLAPYAEIIASDDLAFKLIDFEDVARGYYVPIYEAASAKGSFAFRNVAWQSGGDGPEIVAD